jgi:hypothetical protein
MVAVLSILCKIIVVTTPEHPPRDEDLSQEEALKLHERFREAYEAYFNEHPEHGWVMVSDQSEQILGGGTDAQTLSEEAFEALEHELGGLVHLFGRPIFIEHS